MSVKRAADSRTLKGLGLVFFIVGLVLLLSSSTAYAGLMGLGAVLFLAGYFRTAVRR